MKLLPLFATVVLAFTACQQKSAPANGPGSGAAPTAPTTPTTPTAAKRAPGPWSATEIGDIAKVTFPDYKASVLATDDNRAAIRHYKNREGSNLATFATVTASVCKECVPMELAKWQAKAAALKAVTVDPEILDATTFELGEATVAGRPMIKGFQSGQAGTAYTHAAHLWFNDGVNEIWVLVQYGDNQLESAEKMEQFVPRASLEAAAERMMTEYLARF